MRGRHSLALLTQLGVTDTVADSEDSYVELAVRLAADTAWRQDVVEEGFTVEKKGRIVRANTKPGLGITINEAEVKRHPFEQELLQRVFYPDGSVGDW